MRIGANYPEKKDNYSDIYFKFMIFGIITAGVIVVGIKGLNFIFYIVIEYWLWVIGLGISILLIKWFIRRKK